MTGRASVRIAAFALLASVLIVTTPTAALKTSLVVESNHTTTADFETSVERANISVHDDAVHFNQETAGLIDDFEDGDATDTVATDWGDYTQDTGAFTTTTTNPLNGTTSANLTAAYGVRKDLEVPHDTSTTKNISWSVRLDKQGGADASSAIFRVFDGGTQVTRMSLEDDGDVQVFDGNTQTEIGVWAVNQTMVLELSFDFAANQVTITKNNTILGTFAFRNSAASYDTFEFLLNDGPAGSGTRHLTVDQLHQPTGQTGPGTYISANHTVERSEQGFANLSTLSNAEVVVTFEGSTDGGPWQQLAQNTFTTPGNKTLSWTPSDADRVRVNVTAINQTTNGAPDVVLADEGVQFTARQPEVDNDSAAPTGQLQTTTPTLSIPVNDSDFALSQGDSVEVVFRVDGSVEGKDTLTSNSTASITTSALAGGDHTWNATINDSYGLSNASDDYTITVPDTLEIRNVTNTSELVDGTEVTVTFFDGTVVERTTNDGTVDLTGLPVGERFTVQAQASGFHDRLVVIDSIFQQQTVYMLSTKFTAVSIAFELDDATGKFKGSDVEILVERPLNISGTTEWRRVSGDLVGADGSVSTLLQQDQRYRIIVRNQQESRILGSYVASSAADPEVLPIGEVTFEGDVEDGVGFAASQREIDGDRDIQLTYFDAADNTSELKIEIINTTDDTTLYQATTTDPSQRHVATVDIPASAADNTTYQVIFNATRDGLEDRDGVRYVGDVGELTSGWPIDAQVLSLMGWVGLYALAGFFALRNQRLAPAGIVTVAFAFDMFGVFSIHPALMGIAGATAVVFLVAGERP